MVQRFLSLVLWMMLNYFLFVSGNSEGDALSAFKNSLTDPKNVMMSWDATLGNNPCTWVHITCDNENRVTRIDLGNMGLSGRLVTQLGSLPNLQYLELNSNNISGGIPAELGNLTNLVSLDLYENNLTGPIPHQLGRLPKLRFLRLNNNTLSGEIPVSLTSLFGLQVLDLSNNNLSGEVPVNGSFTRFVGNSFKGNCLLNTSTPVLDATPIHAPQSSAPGVGSFSTILIVGSITILIVGGIVIATVLLYASFVAALVLWRRRKLQDHFFDVSAEDYLEIHLGKLNWFSPSSLTMFSLKELLVATHNFDPKNLVGRGGFGEVYKGRLADASLVAVKRIKDVQSRVEDVQFQAEVEMISLVDHRNLLRLQGFCMTRTEKLLVYPYMANGSLASCLRGAQHLLDWPKRKRIALGSARGLAYLHHQFDPKIIHCDVKAANVLLDEKFEAVVGDFGLAELMDCKDTHVTREVRGTIGHIAPEYFSDGKCSEKTDIFGYGVLLLELVSGQKTTHLGQIALDHGFLLHNWVKGLMKDKKLEMLVDGNLQGGYVEEEVEQLVQVALLCTQSSPMRRPTMSEVVRMLEGSGLAKRWKEWRNQEAFCRESEHALNPNAGLIVDSTSKLHPDKLSGPR